MRSERCHSQGHAAATSAGARSANCSREKARTTSAMTRSDHATNPWRSETASTPIAPMIAYSAQITANSV